MGIRETQVMGLHEGARALIELGEVHAYREHIRRAYPDGRIEEIERDVSQPRVQTCDSGQSITGMFGESYPLMAYRLPDGRVLTEAVQHETWSSGPVFYLALCDGKGALEPESLWPEAQMEGLEPAE